MSDQWDTKYPGNLPLWSDHFRHAEEEIGRGAPWKPAFAAVVRAFHAGELRGLQDDCYRSDDVAENQKRLWEKLRDEVFAQPPGRWPNYAKKVWNAIPPDMRDKDGRTIGIPEAWLQDHRRQWAFKITVLFIDGVIHGDLPVSLADSLPSD